MMKIVLTLAIVVLALMWWFGKGRGGGASSSRRKGAAPGQPAAQAMVACAHCGLHLPQPDAVEGEGDRHYCSVEHRRLGPPTRR